MEYLKLMKKKNNKKKQNKLYFDPPAVNTNKDAGPWAEPCPWTDVWSLYSHESVCKLKH